MTKSTKGPVLVCKVEDFVNAGTRAGSRCWHARSWSTGATGWATTRLCWCSCSCCRVGVSPHGSWSRTAYAHANAMPQKQLKQPGAV